MTTTRRLDDIATIIMGQAPPGGSYNSNNQGWPLIAGAGDFRNGRVVVKKHATEATKLSQAGDIVLSIRASIGDKVMVDGEYCLGRGVAAIRAGSGVDQGFLWHYLSSIESRLASKGRGATFKQVNRSDIGELPIILPTMEEQRRVAEVLDQADELRTKRWQAIGLVDDLSKSVFRDMFGEPVLSDGRWPVVAVADAGAVQLGRQRAPKYQTGKYTRPYLRVANVFEDRIDTSDVLSMDFDSADFSKYKLAPGDILLNEGQSTELVGRPAMWRDEIPDCCFQNTLVRFRPHADLVEAEYALAVFLRLFHTGQFARISSKTSSVAHLGASRFAKMPFPLPPLGVQRSYVAKARELRAVRASLISHLSRLDELFASLQARAFQGGCGRLTPSPAQR